MAVDLTLAQKRDDLAASAETAIDLAAKERMLANDQHLLAHRLENLADSLTEQVSVADSAIEADAAANGSPALKARALAG